MKRLSPTLALGHGEPPLAYVSRLALRNGIASAGVMCTHLGLRYQAIADGDADEVARFADIAGADPRTLSENAIRKVAGGYDLKGERLLKSTLRRTHFRFCPSCLLNDQHVSDDPPAYAPFVRVSWLLTPIRTCPEHGIALLQREKTTNEKARFEFSQELSGLAPDFERLASGALKRSPSDLELYLFQRLSYGTPRIDVAPWLDDLEWHAVAKTSEVMGVVSLYGRKQGLRRLSELQLHAAGARGFEFLRRGADGLRDFLRGLFDSFPMTRRSNAEAQAVIGKSFHGFLARGAPDAGFEPVKEIVREFIVANFEVTEGAMVLDRPLGERRSHSLRSAYLETGLHPKRLRKLLISAGVVTADQAQLSDNRVLMDAEKVREIIEIETASFDHKTIEPYLGLGRPHPKKLKDAGLIATIPWTGKSAHAKPKFAKVEVDRFLSSLYEGAVPVEVAPVGSMDPVAAGKNSCSTLVDVLNLILSRKLANVWKVAGGVGVTALAVMPEEVRGLLCGAPVDGIAPFGVQYRLGTTHAVMTAFIAIGVFKTEEITNPVHGGKSKVIPTADVEEFERTYVSLMQLGKIQGRHFLRVVRDFEARGIKPAWDPKVVHSRWYRRIHILAI